MPAWTENTARVLVALNVGSAPYGGEHGYVDVTHRGQRETVGRGATRYPEFVAAMTMRFVFLPPRFASGVRGLLV
jgi:hypothetical protein